MSQKIKVTCPYCHYWDTPDLMIEVIFSNVTFTFKCKQCKKEVRIYIALKEYGEITYEK